MESIGEAPTQATPDATFTFELLNRDHDLDDDSLTVVAASNGNHGRVAVRSDGSLDYRPDRDFFGIDQFACSVVDGAGRSGEARVTVLVREGSGPVAAPAVDPSPSQPPLEPPAFDEPPEIAPPLIQPREEPPAADRHEAADDAVIVVDLFEFHDIHDRNAQIRLRRGPTDGKITLNDDGTLTYRPFPEFVGTDRFAYTLTRADGSSLSGTVMLNVDLDADAGYDDGSDESEILISVDEDRAPAMADPDRLQPGQPRPLSEEPAQSWFQRLLGRGFRRH